MKALVSIPKKLFWPQIQEMYANQWVELSDVDWPVESPLPKRAIVRTFDSDRAQLLQKISARNSRRLSTDTVVLFIGGAQSRLSLSHINIAA